MRTSVSFPKLSVYGGFMMKFKLLVSAVLVFTSVSGWSCSNISDCDDSCGSTLSKVKATSRVVSDESLDASRAAIPVIKDVSKELLEIAASEVLRYGAERVGLTLPDSGNLVSLGIAKPY